MQVSEQEAAIIESERFRSLMKARAIESFRAARRVDPFTRDAQDRYADAERLRNAAGISDEELRILADY